MQEQERAMDEMVEGETPSGLDADHADDASSRDDDPANPDALSESALLSARVSSLEAEVAEWKEHCLRLRADAENVRRRATQTAEDSRKRANEALLLDLLPMADNFARALAAAEQSSSMEGLIAGVDQILRQFQEFLGRHGVEPIVSLGQPFDPNLHEAIGNVPAEDGQAPNTVVDELRVGYRLHERVLRPSLVRVTTG